MKNITAYLLIALFTISINTGCKPREKKLNTNETTDYSVFADANTLYMNYKSNIEKFDNVYKGKDLVVQGLIHEYFKTKENEVVIVLTNGRMNFGVQCTLKNSKEQITEPLSKGKNMKIMGKCTGMTDNVNLIDCQILK